MVGAFHSVDIMGRFLDILVWNPMAHALLAGQLDFDAPNHPADRPNVARLVFLDPHMRELYDDWPRKARSTVEDLRLIAGENPSVPELSNLIGELTLGSPEFAQLWAAHAVGDCGGATRAYHHPMVGPMVLLAEFMTLPNDEGQRVAVFNAEPGSPSEAALRILADLTAATTPISGPVGTPVHRPTPAARTPTWAATCPQSYGCRSCE